MRFVRMLISVAIVAGLGLGLSGEANASSVYAYSQQRLTNFAIDTTATISVLTAANTSTFNSASVTGFAPAVQVGATDALQAYSGAPPAPAENTFTPKGQVGASWARGDALITTIPVINGVNGSMRNVAEGFLSSLPNGDGLGQWSLSYEFDVTSTGSLSMTTDFLNELTAQVTASLAGANATASFSLTVNLICTNPSPCGNQSGVFAPNDLNDATSQNGPGNGLSQVGPTSGTSSITPLSLVAGNHYVLTVNADEHISLQDVTAPIPEPGTWMLMGTGLLGLLGYGWQRKRIA